MGVYIKGVEMPKNCTFCEMWHGVDCHPYQGISPPKSRPDHCPLISIPPHGDLVDINRLKVDVINQEYSDNASADLIKVFRLINTAPTIIPADGGE